MARRTARGSGRLRRGGTLRLSAGGCNLHAVQHRAGAGTQSLWFVSAKLQGGVHLSLTSMAALLGAQACSSLWTSGADDVLAETSCDPQTSQKLALYCVGFRRLGELGSPIV